MDSNFDQITNWLGSGAINIFGRPFAGKDTQGQVLSKLLNGELISGGDILRSYPDQEKIKQLMSTGDLFPTDFYLEIVLPYLSRDEYRGKPLILSSIGRLKGEESTILKACRESDHPLKAVILLDLSEEEVWRRFDAAKKLNDRGERADDTHEALENRLQKFNQQTLPVIEAYRNNNLLITVDGSRHRDEVTENIVESLIKHFS